MASAGENPNSLGYSFLIFGAIVLVRYAFVPLLNTGIPIEREGRYVCLQFGWLAFFSVVTLVVYFAAGVIAKRVDRSGRVLRELFGFEVAVRTMRFLGRFVFDPREIPDGLDITTLDFYNAYSYLIWPAWYWLGYGVLAVVGLFLGSKVLDRTEPPEQ